MVWYAMRHRERRRIDWDEEIQKTERIRRKGFFISLLGFGIAGVFIFVAKHRADLGVELIRKIIFAVCVILSMLILRITLRRRERLKRERQEKEQERMIERIRQTVQKSEE